MKQGRISIDGEQCKGCYLCIKACPRKVIRIGATANSAGTFPASFAEDSEKDTACIACGSCYLVCPDTAIEVYEV